MCIVHFSREVEAEFKAHFSLEIDRFTLPACIENATVRRTLCAAAAPPPPSSPELPSPHRCCHLTRLGRPICRTVAYYL